MEDEGEPRHAEEPEEERLRDEDRRAVRRQEIAHGHHPEEDAPPAVEDDRGVVGVEAAPADRERENETRREKDGREGDVGRRRPPVGRPGGGAQEPETSPRRR